MAAEQVRTRHFRQLLAWQKAMALARLVYSVSERFPKAEVYGLTAQMRRAAVSVPSNIAEGHGRRTDRSFALFLAQARGSLFELETQAELAHDFRYCSPEEQQQLHTLRRKSPG